MIRPFLLALLLLLSVYSATTDPNSKPGTIGNPDQSSTFDTLGQDSLSWDWNQGPLGPSPAPKPPKTGPTPSSPTGVPSSTSDSNGEEFILGDADGASVIQTLLGKHSSQKAV